MSAGDQYACECPYCGKIIRDLWDLGAGLCGGGTLTCDHCGKEVAIVTVETTVDVMLAKQVSP